MDKNNPLRTDAATTDTDPAANQTYTAPAADANLEKLSKKIKKNYLTILRIIKKYKIWIL